MPETTKRVSKEIYTRDEVGLIMAMLSLDADKVQQLITNHPELFTITAPTETEEFDMTYYDGKS
jgi:hypothetical protein